MYVGQVAGQGHARVARKQSETKRRLPMPRTPRVPTALILAMASMGLSSAQAMGVGRPQTLSALGQPLNLLFPVQLAPGENLTPDCVRAEVQAGESRLPATLVQLQLEGESENAVRAVRLRSALQVDEPLVTIQLSLGCPARLTRQYTAFIDPPGSNLAPAPAAPVSDLAVVQTYSPALRAALATAEARPAALLAGRAASAPEPAAQLAAVAPEASASAASAAPARVKRSRPAATATASGEPAAGTAAPGAKTEGRSPVAAPRRAAPRLQMEPAELLETPSPQPASAASAAQDEEARQRLAKLEQSLQQMQAQQKESEARLAVLQARLAQAEAPPYGHPLTLGLGLLSLALLGFSAWLWRGRQSDRRLHESAWWDELKQEQREARRPDPAPPVAASPAQPAPAPVSPEPALVTSPPVAASRSAADADAPALVADPRTWPMAALQPEVELADAAAEPISFQLVEPSAPAPLVAAPAQPGLTVEALIDLDQQVDFFQVLGQDEAAIDLLNSHLDATSPLPHLLLLALYRRRGETEALAALEADYARRFGVPAPQPELLGATELGLREGLESRPELLNRLQARWSDHGASMSELQGLLTGAAGEGLDLAVCRDLLLLYGVARDLSEHEVRSSDIDLFLPLDTPAADMMATMVIQAPVSVNSRGMPLEVDIPLGEDEGGELRPSQAGRLGPF
jgi:hypothetical protein